MAILSPAVRPFAGADPDSISFLPNSPGCLNGTKLSGSIKGGSGFQPLFFAGERQDAASTLS
jgi:hypothetical protein